MEAVFAHSVYQSGRGKCWPIQKQKLRSPPSLLLQVMKNLVGILKVLDTVFLYVQVLLLRFSFPFQEFVSESLEIPKGSVWKSRGWGTRGRCILFVKA